MSSKERFYTFCTDWLITRTTPHSRSTWESKPNRYTAYQSPLLLEEPSGTFTQYSETLLSFA